MFKSLLLVILAGGAVSAQAALDLTQSSPAIKWNSISNEAVRVIYPDVLGAESIYIANLVEHYSHFVGQTYAINKPQKFDLIVRPEMSQPNGFVAMAPRRSEWFASSMYMPYVGSTEWYQTLAIHEYRHVNQFDFYNRDASQILYYLMGDMGRNLSVFLALPSWYLEGDAVWAETKYTDGGRGRSPRFMARLKALVLSDKLPTYDQFLNGSYQTNLPNQYVYGYALISYATQKYGDDIWQKIVNDVSKFPQPFRLYHSFKDITGQEFKDFYIETMNDLRTKWAKDAPGAEEPVDYREASAPFKVGSALYYVDSDLNSYPTLMKEENGHKEKIVEFYYNKEILGFSVGTTRGVYTEYLPDSRYAYKGSSDLVVVDLKSGETNKITSGARLYNPSFNSSETKIIATSFNQDQTWTIAEYDLQGKLLRSVPVAGNKIAEAHYIDDRHAAVLMSSKTGHKSIVVLDLETKTVSKVILPPSRNLLNSLYVDKNKNILFEAQYKGGNEIFRFNGEGIARCTNTKLGAFTPSSDGINLYFSNMDTYGSTIASQSLQECRGLPSSELVDFKYLGDSPSDNYNKFPLQHLKTQEELFTKNASQYHPEEYGDVDERLFIPHTWGLNIGRGGGLIVQTDNYLHTMGFTAQAGTNAEEAASFFNLGLDYKKYYPIFRIETEYRGRRVKDFGTGTEVKWGELNSGFSMNVPYIKKAGLYNFMTLVSLGAQY
ncbi:MAG: TolB family protein, partial [Bacillota bacterium]